MSNTVIQVDHLAKKYVLSHQQEKSSYKSLREAIANSTRSLGQRLLKPYDKKMYKPAREEFWALKDLSFEIDQGERVGIIGRNGAGRSTLLKVLSRITKPTRGCISIKGRVGSLLEVGTGFHPELTGRENIYLNGAILGMSKVDIKRKFDEIVAFAEVEKFLDTPVKRYSSGMYVRLAFAVAAHLEPEILVVDEVLAVGDAQFQKKCLGKMGEVSKDGRTILFVSHNMAAVRSLCTSGIVMNKGNLIYQGLTTECIKIYGTQNMQTQGSEWVRPSNLKDGSLVITQIGSALNGKQPNLELELEISLESRIDHKSSHLAIDILDATGTAIMQAIPSLKNYIDDTRSRHLVKVKIQLPPLIPGQYLASIWVGSHNTETLDWIKEAIAFEVNESPTPGRSFPHTPDHGYIVPQSVVSILEYQY